MSLNYIDFEACETRIAIIELRLYIVISKMLFLESRAQRVWANEKICDAESNRINTIDTKILKYEHKNNNH